MAQTHNIVLAGFGGQGVLFAGKVIANAGLLEGRELSWLPSYGPEMRGGTANCSVVLSDEPIGSPLVTTPNSLIALNQPSFDKFRDSICIGGVAIVDETLIPKTAPIEGVKLCCIPATQMAEDAGLAGLGNIICVGKLFVETQFCQKESLIKALENSVPPRKAALIEKNKQALELGMNF